MEQQKKNKGGRPSGTKERYFNRKVTLYLSDEEYSRLDDFLQHGWRDHNYSSAARFLLLYSLEKWVKKGKKPVSLRGEF
jgi:hypothetical protein